MSRQTEESHYPSAMNLQDFLDMSNAIPEDCASSLPKSNAHRALATGNRVPSHPPATPATTDATTVINYEDSLLAKIGALLKSNALADVTLIVGGEKIVMHAHKLLLGLSSPVFTAMFFGELANTQQNNAIPSTSAPPTIPMAPITRHNVSSIAPSSSGPPSGLAPLSPSSWQAKTVIEIPDCTPQAMQSFLQYIYTNGSSDHHSAPISVDEALSLLYAARKYSVRGLEDKCIVTLSSSITADNVFDILYAANFYNLSSLDYLCWEFMEDNPVEVLNTHLTYLTHDTIQSILRNDKLNCKEVELFQVLMKWAAQECAKLNLEPCPENIRRTCATELKMIRFPIMSGTEFADVVVPTEVLTVEQIAKIFTTINTSEERKKEQQDPNFPSRSSVLLHGMEFSSQKRTPNAKPIMDPQAQGPNPEDDENISRPPVFTFIAEQQIRNRDQQQLQTHQQPVNGGSNNVAATTTAAGNAHLGVNPNNAVTNNGVTDRLDYAIPGLMGMVPLAVSSPVTQAGAGERGRSRQRQRRNRRRNGSNSSTESQNPQ